MASPDSLTASGSPDALYFYRQRGNPHYDDNHPSPDLGSE